MHDSFGKEVAKLAIKNNVDAVIMYDTNANQCWKILKEKAPHIKRILDVTIGNRLYLEKIYREDEKTKGMCVVIEHFPSFRDLTEQIDYFFQNVNAKNKNYDIEYKNSYCVIYFYSKEVSFAFILLKFYFI